MTSLLDDGSRWSFGGDEFVFVELSEEMSLATTLRVISIVNELRACALDGVLDICAAHVSYMIRVDPEVCDPRTLPDLIRELHRRCDDRTPPPIEARLIEIPVLYDDPWTRETLLRFRDRHQAPELTDIEYCARINGFDDVAGYVDAHSSSPHLATFIGFVPGNSESYHLVPRAQQLQAPKYLSPRTDTPARALACGGAFTVVYPVRGLGGFQMIGRSAVPTFDADGSIPQFDGQLTLARGGDIFKYRAVERDEYDDIEAAVAAGTYRYRIHATTFDLAEFTEDPQGYNSRMLQVLHV